MNSSIAATLMLIVAPEFDLGSCWVKLAKDDEVLSVVNAPSGYYHTGTIAFGYPDENPKRRPRISVKEVVSSNQFGTPW
ncbi:MAG: hypothetical protein JSV51_03100 [Candidatus Bathyarchaeota archaeon]|nr:MAG: hypothetical protein JSV51_03100 [Candidatus Bathyarchaeota archaeon]